MSVFDVHLHSTASDGDVNPADLVAQALKRSVAGISLTDHNGVWGLDDAQRACHHHRVPFIAGIEITSRYQGTDVHILGYSRAFARDQLEAGLTTTRHGYADRIAAMVERCQAQGYVNIRFDDIVTARRHLKNPSYISYDVAQQLQRQHQVSPAQARALTVAGGACYVPYGDWALSPAAVISLLHNVNALAVIAHPGTIVFEAGQATLADVLQETKRHQLDGIEVFHPFHDATLTADLLDYTHRQKLLITGGSDWHGPQRHHDASFGSVGMTAAQFATLQDKVP